MNQVCPVCKGVGLVGHNFYDLNLNPNRVTFNELPNRITCRACNGVGIITDFPNSRIADIAKLEEQLKAKDEAYNALVVKFDKDDEKNVYINGLTKHRDVLLEVNAKLAKALSELVHLHSCEQEGLASGKPTGEQWFNAVNKAHDVLWLKENPSEIQPEDFENGLLELINAYVEAGLSKTDLVHKMQYVTKSCEIR